MIPRALNIYSKADFVVSHLSDVRWFLIGHTGLINDGIPYCNAKQEISCLIHTSAVLSRRLLLMGETGNQQ